MSFTLSSPHFHYLEICCLSFKFKEKFCFVFDALKMKVTQSCPTLCIPMDCIPPGSSVHGVGCSSLLQGSNPGVLHCRQILYHLSHKGSPSITYLLFTEVKNPIDKILTDIEILYKLFMSLCFCCVSLK